MQMDEQEDTTTYKVVVNHEEQYSIWPTERDTPLGWRDTGIRGHKQDCLTYIETVWTDMRPLSLRTQMEATAQRLPPASPTTSPSREQVTTGRQTVDELVLRLCTGDHPLESSRRSTQPVQALQESIAQGYVHLTFTATQGGTELGVRLDRDSSNTGRADFVNQTGTVHLEGWLTLNYVPVRCIADLDLHTLKGSGHLERIGP
jgi:uncharacterized protein YbdZ (MbtH family)